ncbi:MAG TPA: hypothetical protein PK821_07425, partial [Victivallales bacterium]|nr:hypothetical protein [Victivallales bacterium]
SKAADIRECDTYHVLTPQYSGGQMKWTPEKFGSGFEAVFSATKKWGGKNVFVIFDHPREKIEKAWLEKGLNSNLKFIGEFKTHKGLAISLYQGEETNE